MSRSPVERVGILAGLPVAPVVLLRAPGAGATPRRERPARPRVLGRGGVEAGPNAVLALAREGYRKRDVNLGDVFRTVYFKGFWAMTGKYWQTGLGELYRSLSKTAFVRALQNLLPEITENDLIPGGAGVRAQAVAANGALVDDFVIKEGRNAIHVLNAPSPGATASLAIGQTIAEMAAKSFSLAR